MDTNMLLFSKVLSFFKVSDPMPPRDSIPSLLVPGELAKKPLHIWYTELVNLTNDESARYTAFKLTTIFHWERSGKFNHEGLTFVFERDPRSIVYLRVDRMSFENDPWQDSKDSSHALIKSLGISPKEAGDQDGGERNGRAADWCQPLDDDAVKKYFIPSKPSSPAKNSTVRSLGMTHFRTSDIRPSLVDVVLAAYAVSRRRPDYHFWAANCWWLARSIRLFIRTQWGGEDDGEIPRGILADMRDEELVKDQDGIRLAYEEFDTIRASFLPLWGG